MSMCMHGHACFGVCGPIGGVDLSRSESRIVVAFSWRGTDHRARPLELGRVEEDHRGQIDLGELKGGGKVGVARRVDP